ncbi:sorbosone dehydrogenase [Sphingobium jiangsuense]|uniref:Glucose/arabinose dehydrogenase n=1 Tax=Sphingobium jiangsuense TaxID=870476 RepID=A0A7W6FRN7_9SPHN|nr:sorbosone dehydrogenase family protein [Sphingobium jiangsuense]MBB3928183.1 glucose/arabinose dehydrogenase [Sphingobium jiangsuense]GLT00804.1 sorbosone dehydrogenase [Sphingobium jiangsuense]
MKKHILALSLIFILIGAGAVYWLTRPDVARLAAGQDVGREPVFTPARPQWIPTVAVARAVGWPAGKAPVAAQGLSVAPFAEGLEHPRSMLRLPNGDILVAETNSPPRPGTGIVGRVMNHFMNKAGADVPSANRITLLRDADKDGKAEVKTAFLTGLNSPYGMALVGDTLYVANTDAVMAFPYKEGETKIADKGRKVISLPHGAPNRHWTRNLIASPDGRLLYVAIGSNSNVAEGGLETETNRAAIIEVNLETGDNRVFASGLRNPVGMAWNPVTGALWAVVNERDGLGSDLVPDFLTRVEFGGFYGWPWNYWGGYEDKRVEPGRPELREYTHRPDYALGNHVAPLGLAFATASKLGAPFEQGAFVGLHGSWNRVPAAGYKVVFVPFDAKGVPQGKPVDVLGGFLSPDNEAYGRPVDVLVDAEGALLVSDDVGGRIWRVSRK